MCFFVCVREIREWESEKGDMDMKERGQECECTRVGVLWKRKRDKSTN